MQLWIDGQPCRALIDTGCTDNIVHAAYCKRWRPQSVTVTTISGDPFACCGKGNVTVETPTGQSAEIEVLVVSAPPMGVDAIVGMSGIAALGGVSVLRPSEVRFCGATRGSAPEVETGTTSRTATEDTGVAGRPEDAGAASRPAAKEEDAGPASRPVLEVDAPDFRAKFDAEEGVWKVAWKWSDGVGPERLNNTIPQYRVSKNDQAQFDEELDAWIANGWLLPYDSKRYGPPRGLIALMAVPQPNKGKVRPVLDYREMNEHLNAHTAEAEVCPEQLRKWRRHGRNVAVVDLKKAYLQLHVEEQLWSYQTVIVRGKRYALSRLGFGNSVASQIMKAVVRTVLEQDPTIAGAVLPYADDLLVNEDIVDAERVVGHFQKFGLVCKAPERVTDAAGARLLGLRTELCGEQMRWRRDNAVEPPPDRLTRRSVFAWCGQLVAHLPVCGWLRPAVAWLKRLVNNSTRGWDDVTDDPVLSEGICFVADRLSKEDPARGRWFVNDDACIVWVDASSIAKGVVLETRDGEAIEDASWLRKDTDTHINMAELDAAIRGLNLAIAWEMKTVKLRTDSAAVHKWLSDAFSGRARLRTKAHGEMLIRRRVGIVQQLVSEFELSVSVELVPSSSNHADRLTRVPKEWVRREDQDDEEGRGGADPTVRLCGVLTDVGAEGTAGIPPSAASIRDVHERAGHPGVRKTLYFARREISRDVTRSQVQAVVRRCDICSSVDPAPVKWRHGKLAVTNTWERLAADITHHQGKGYLTIIDCGPSRFSIWRQILRADSATVIQQMEEVFYERGAPLELLLDNDTVFRSRDFAIFAARWNVELRFRAVYEPSGNGIIERCHRTIKVIAARKGCSVAEAVHLYNVSPRDEDSRTLVPAAVVYRYTVRDNIRMTRTPPEIPTEEEDSAEVTDEGAISSLYAVGDPVWLRRRGTRCSEASHRGVVTGVVSDQVVEVDGAPWHVRNLRRRHESPTGDEERQAHQKDDIPLLVSPAVPLPLSESGPTGISPADIAGREPAGDSDEPVTPSNPGETQGSGPQPELRRSSRNRKAPDRWGYS